MCWEDVDPVVQARRAFAIWAAVLLASFAGTIWLGDAGGVQAFHGQAWVREHERAVELFSAWGLYPFYGLFTIALWVGWRRNDRCLKVLSVGYLFAQLVGPVASVRLLKILAGRPRPYAVLAGRSGTDWIGPTWQSAFHSFPSGHAADVVTGAIFASLLWRWPKSSVWWVLAVLVAASRVALARHYPSDVLAGAVLAGAASFAIIRIWVIPRLSLEVGDSPPQRAKDP
jgi:membrane-associated phospholipid phosphatase